MMRRPRISNVHAENAKAWMFSSSTSRSTSIRVAASTIVMPAASANCSELATEDAVLTFTNTRTGTTGGYGA